MKQLILRDITYNIPTRWEDITIRQQLTVERLAKENPDFKPLAIVAGYCGLDVQDVKRLHFDTVRTLLSELEFIKTPFKNEPVHEFSFSGESYTVMHSLLKAEFQDFLSLESAIDNHRNNPYNALPFIVAILAKRKGESLDKIDIEARAELFRSLPITTANAIYGFFLHSALLSSIDSRKALIQQDRVIQELMKSIESTLNRQSGGGLRTRLQREKLKLFLKSLKKKWRQYYSGLNLEKEKSN